jgi:hypothetical protein
MDAGWEVVVGGDDAGPAGAVSAAGVDRFDLRSGLSWGTIGIGRCAAGVLR